MNQSPDSRLRGLTCPTRNVRARGGTFGRPGHFGASWGIVERQKWAEPCGLDPKMRESVEACARARPVKCNVTETLQKRYSNVHVEACARARPVKALPASGEAQRSRRKKATV